MVRGAVRFRPMLQNKIHIIMKDYQLTEEQSKALAPFINWKNGGVMPTKEQLLTMRSFTAEYLDTHDFETIEEDFILIDDELCNIIYMLF